MNEINDAIMSGQYDMATELFKEGKSWDLNSFMKTQAYEKIIRDKQFGLLQAFIDKGHISIDVFECDSFDNTIFSMLARAKTDDELLAFLDSFLPQVENIDDELGGITWLGYSIKNKASMAFIEKLVDHGCDINFKDPADRTLIFHTNDKEILQFLLDQGIDVNAKDKGGDTMLFEAIASGNEELAQLLLDHGAETNLQNSQGETPYHRAVFYAMNPELYTLLSNYEPHDTGLKNRQGQTLFFQFISQSQISSENERELIKLMLNDGADLFRNEPDGYGEEKTAALILAGKTDYSAELFDLIVESDGFDPNAQDNEGNTFLHYVCSSNLNFDQNKAKVFYQKVKAMLKAGADPNIRNDRDKTPVDLAMDDNLKAKGLELLLKHKN